MEKVAIIAPTFSNIIAAALDVFVNILLYVLQCVQLKLI